MKPYRKDLAREDSYQFLGEVLELAVSTNYKGLTKSNEWIRNEFRVALKEHLRRGVPHHLSHPVRILTRRKHECPKSVTGLIHGSLSQPRFLEGRVTHPVSQGVVVS